MRQMHAGQTALEVFFKLRFHLLPLTLQCRRQVEREHDDAIFRAFAVAHRDLRVAKVDIFHPVRYLLSRALR